MVAMTKPVKWLFPLACCSVLFLRTAAWGQDDTLQSLRIPAAAQHDNQLQQHNQEQRHQEQHQEHHEKRDVDASGQNQQQEMEHTHHHGEIPIVAPETPHLGRAQERATGAVYRLEELERIALARNPTLAQAAAEIDSARGRRLQSGLYPNPKVGYEGEEIRGGAYGGGEQGFLVEQVFVTAGKLGLDRKVGDAEIRRAEAEAEAQRFRVLNAVRIAYYRVLAGQEMLDAKTDLQRISREILKITSQLHNVGQADDTEVLQAEIEAQEADIAVITQQNALARLWTALTVVVASPHLQVGTVQGNLEADLPQLDEPQLLDSLLKESPAIKIAQAELTRAEARLSRARREPIPDIEVKAGVQQNNEPLEGARSVGVQSFAEVKVQLHIFDRNQGNVAAAKGDVEKAQKELQRIDLILRGRFAATVQNYHNARIVVERYHDEILPRAQRAYELMLTRYGLMTASFTQVLNLQRTLYATETGYISALGALWTNSIVLQGFLLTGGLETPGHSVEVDLESMPASSMFNRPNPPSMGNSPVAPGGMDSSMDR